MTTNTYKATLQLGYGRGSDTLTEPGDILMSAQFELTLVSGVGESPKSHRELVLRAADDMNKNFKEWVCSDNFGVKRQQCLDGSVRVQEDADRMQETS